MTQGSLEASQFDGECAFSLSRRFSAGDVRVSQSKASH